MKVSIIIFTLGTGSVTLWTALAEALPLPDNSACSKASQACLSITNNGADQSTGIYGYASSGPGGVGTGVYGGSDTGYGLFGYASQSQGVGAAGDAPNGIGVMATSGNYIGVYASSTSNNAVFAENGRTDWSSAVISAAPGNSNGLAIWAGGGAQKPGGGSWSATSDARVKRDVKDFHAGIHELMGVRPVRYKYNGLADTQDDGNEFVGVIAQELEKVLPEMVKSRKGKLRRSDDKESDIKVVDPSAFTYLLINAVQQQQRIIDDQEARLTRIEQRRSPAISSVLPGSLGGLALGFVPVAWVVANRKRRDSQS